MTENTTDIYARVHNRVDEILHYVWDPIGVAGVAEARDEYDSYVPQVVRMLFDGKEEKEIAQFPYSMEGDRMGLTVESRPIISIDSELTCAPVADRTKYKRQDRVKRMRQYGIMSCRPSFAK